MTDTTTGTPTPARPKYYDDAVRERAVGQIIVDVSDWLQETSQFGQKALKDVLVRCIDTNGYTYAHNLEQRYGWAPDAHLVSILAGISLHDAYDAVVALWVQNHDIKIPFSVGTEISTVRHPKAKITKCMNKYARLVIRVEGVLYSPDFGGEVINFEDATPILGTIGEAPAPEGGAA